VAGAGRGCSGQLGSARPFGLQCQWWTVVDNLPCCIDSGSLLPVSAVIGRGVDHHQSLKFAREFPDPGPFCEVIAGFLRKTGLAIQIPQAFCETSSDSDSNIPNIYATLRDSLDGSIPWSVRLNSCVLWCCFWFFAAGVFDSCLL